MRTAKPNIKCHRCKKTKREYAAGMCSRCYGLTQECFRIIFQIKIGPLEFTIRRRFVNRKEYMAWWQKKNKDHLNAYKRQRYKLTKNKNI